MLNVVSFIFGIVRTSNYYAINIDVWIVTYGAYFYLETIRQHFGIVKMIPHI